MSTALRNVTMKVLTRERVHFSSLELPKKRQVHAPASVLSSSHCARLYSYGLTSPVRIKRPPPSGRVSDPSPRARPRSPPPALFLVFPNEMSRRSWYFSYRG